MLILVRHGRSDGATGDPPLSAEGFAQTGWLGARLRHRLPAPALVLASPMLRARQSAESLGLGPVQADDAFAPRRTGAGGAGHGMPSWDERPEGGESLRDVAARLRAPLARWTARWASTSCGKPIVPVVLVSHSEVLFVLRSLIEEHWSRDPLTRADDGRALHVPDFGAAIVYRYGESGAAAGWPSERGYLRPPRLSADGRP